MSGFECYKHYIALKNHFTQPKFDYFKYNGKSRLSPDAFDKRNDKLYFLKMAKHPDPINYMVSNLVVNEKVWIKELAYSPDTERVYNDWMKRTQSLSYVFQNDLSKLDTDFNANLVVKNNSHPKLLKLFLGGSCTLETLMILLDMTGAKKHWDKKIQYDPLWEQVSKKIDKYRPFLHYDVDKFRKITLEKFGD
jgi:hypothetical protein